MKIIKILITFFLFMSLQKEVFAQKNSNLKEMMLSANIALDNGDVESLSNLLLAPYQDKSKEYVTNFSKLLVYMHSDRYKDYEKNYAKKSVYLKKDALKNYFFIASAVSRTTGVYMKSCKDNCTYIKEENIYRTKTSFIRKDGTADFKVKKTDKGWLFFPEINRELTHDLLAKTYDIVTSYTEVVMTLPKEKQQEAVDKIIKKHISGTNLAYEDKLISGTIFDNPWSFKKGGLKKSKFFNKIFYNLTLCDTDKEYKDCATLFCSKSVRFTLREMGEFDIALDGLTAGIQYDKKNIEVDEGKIKIEIKDNRAIGVIVLKSSKLGASYISGTFNVPYCEK